MPSHSTRLGAVLASLIPLLAGCNALTGAGDLVIEDDGFAGPKPGPGSIEQIEPNMALATGVTIREIALYQGVKRPLMIDGKAAESDVPIVQQRDALLRVFFETSPRYNGRPVTARFEMDGQPAIEVVAALKGSSNDFDLTSTANFDIPAAALKPGVTYRVAMLQPREQADGDSPGAVFPASGGAPLDVKAAQAAVHVEIVPLLYSADGSNRAPDTSPEQIQRYRERFYAMYPVSEVDISVHEPVRFASEIRADGTGWPDLLDGLAGLRNDQRPSDNVYYYGVFTPAQSFQEFCRSGCVAGLGFVAGASDVNTRVAIGLGYTGDIAIDTAVHEVGHNHGRSHAPCGGADGVDPAFPHAGAGIGAWGYNLLSRTLYDPEQTTDVMGYCSPIWVSDYTFKALFERVELLGSASVRVPEERMNQRYERVRIDGDGNARFLAPVTLRLPPMNEATQVTVDADSGSETVEGHFYKYDHLPGGVMYIAQPASAVRAMRVELDGKVIAARK